MKALLLRINLNCELQKKKKETNRRQFELLSLPTTWNVSSGRTFRQVLCFKYERKNS